jgi:hypothetical protein
VHHRKQRKKRVVPSDRGRRAGRCRHADPVVPEHRSPDRTGPGEARQQIERTRVAGDIGSNDRDELAFGPSCLGAERGSVFLGASDLRPCKDGCTPASAPTNRRRKADRLQILMRVLAVRRLTYRAGL